VSEVAPSEELDVKPMPVVGTSEKLDGELVLVAEASEELDEEPVLESAAGGTTTGGNRLVVAAGVEDGVSPPPRIAVTTPPRSEVTPPNVSPMAPRRSPLVVVGAGVEEGEFTEGVVGPSPGTDVVGEEKGRVVSPPPRISVTTPPRSEVTPPKVSPIPSRRPPFVIGVGEGDEWTEGVTRMAEVVAGMVKVVEEDEREVVEGPDSRAEVVGAGEGGGSTSFAMSPRSEVTPSRTSPRPPRRP